MTRDSIDRSIDHLGKHATACREKGLVALLDDQERCDGLRFEDLGIRIDLSRQCIDLQALDDLIAFADAQDITGKFADLFAGKAINRSEQRPVLHPLARTPDAEPYATTRDAMMHTCAAISRDPDIRHIVHIGIGGSDLGPKFVADALAPIGANPSVTFVGNVHPADLAGALGRCDPAHTLVVITSKTFTTAETLRNANSAKDFIAQAAPPGDARDAWLASRLIGITASPDRALAWGCGTVFTFDDAIGGRFSVWSAVGFGALMAIGPESFQAFLDGAHAMDRHVQHTPLNRNLPLLLGCLRYWNRSVLGFPTQACVPYDHRLALLPAWLQQLEMESNGKSVTHDGTPVATRTAPVIWGAEGTNAQHSFFQMLHQGSDVHPVDILVASDGTGTIAPAAERHLDHFDWQGHQRDVIANAIAQAEALARGEPNDSEPHKAFTGNRPSTVITWKRTDAATLGKLMAFYEHVTIASGFLWDINVFDQWGVALGKRMANLLTAPPDHPTEKVPAGSAPQSDTRPTLSPAAGRLWHDLTE